MVLGFCEAREYRAFGWAAPPGSRTARQRGVPVDSRLPYAPLIGKRLQGAARMNNRITNALKTARRNANLVNAGDDDMRLLTNAVKALCDAVEELAKKTP